MAELENPPSMAVSTASGEASFSSSGFQNAPDEPPPTKKKRNLPGMPGTSNFVDNLKAQS